MKITATTVDTIQVAGNKAEIIVYDDEIPGFGVRVRKAGSRNFVFTYRFGGNSKRMTLGSAVREAFPGIRKRVLELQALVRLGKDPGALRDANKAQAKDDFKTIADRYLIWLPTKVKKNKQPIRARTVGEIERYLLTTAESLHSKPIAGIIRKDIADLLSAVEVNNGAVTANRLRSALSSMFVWAMQQGLCEDNPVNNTLQRGELPRDRTLVRPKTGDMSELVEVWRALGDDAFGDICRMLILSGQRRTEIGGLRWSELDEEMICITIPKERAKNGVEHTLPVSEPMREILARRPRIAGHDLVFAPQSNIGFAGWDAHKKALDERLLQARRAAGREPMAPWGLHDLRRSVATGMAECCGVQPHIVEACLNHISGHKRGVAGVYNHAVYLKEMTAALAMWGEHVLAAVAGKSAKVVHIRGRG
jgi:integrase